jgi:N-acyl-D-aspartate/D-glutamate deacylase
MAALYQVMAGAQRGVLEVAVEFMDVAAVKSHLDEWAVLATAGHRPITWLGIVPSGATDYWRRFLEWSDDLHRRGLPIRPQYCPRPIDVPLSFGRGSRRIQSMAVWAEVLELDPGRWPAAVRDEEWRRRARAEWDGLRLVPGSLAERAEDVDVLVGTDGVETGETRSVAQEARRQGCHPADLLADLLAERTTSLELVVRGVANDDPGQVDEVLSHEAVLIGGGDAGAHVHTFAGDGDTAFLLERARGRSEGSLGEVVRRLTADPAGFFGIPTRGRIAEGLVADLVVFDPEKVSWNAQAWASDLPGGVERRYRPACGVTATLVAGQPVIEEGCPTGVLPGRILKSPVGPMS